MNDLPLEIYYRICECADVDTLSTLRLVSRHLVPPSNSRFWQRRIHRDYGIRPSDINTYNRQNMTNFTSWRQLWLFYSDINWWVYCGQENQPKQLRLMIYFYNCVAKYTTPEPCKKTYSDIAEFSSEEFLQLDVQKRLGYGQWYFLISGHLTAAMVIVGAKTLKSLARPTDGERLLKYYTASGNTYRFGRLLELVQPTYRLLAEIINMCVDQKHMQCARKIVAYSQKFNGPIGEMAKDVMGMFDNEMSFPQAISKGLSIMVKLGTYLFSINNPNNQPT